MFEWYNSFMQYFFILGKNPTLSVAEILSAVSDAKIIEANQEFLIIEGGKIDLKKLQNQLGGTIKIGITQKCDPGDLEKHILTKAKKGEKFIFGFSFYGSFKKQEIKEIQKQGMEIKKTLKQKDVPSRFVVSKEKTLSSVIVTKEKLLEKGVEICFLNSNNKIFIGQTQTVQEFEKYSARDYARPGRDIISGMLPPKIAKMMINLARIKPNNTVLDPFCGSGTIIQEAILLGYKNIIGSDISEKAINDTKKNLEWLSSVVPDSDLESRTNKPLDPRIKSEDNHFVIKMLDVKTISQELKPNSINAIITEPYLGPPLKGNESKQQIEKIVKELSDLYLIAFEQFKIILKPNSKVVMIFPAFKFKNEILFLPIMEQIEKIGYKKITEFGNYSIDRLKKLHLSFSSRNTLLYSRPDQKIKREILLFEKLKG